MSWGVSGAVPTKACTDQHPSKLLPDVSPVLEQTLNSTLGPMEADVFCAYPFLNRRRPRGYVSFRRLTEIMLYNTILI